MQKKGTRQWARAGVWSSGPNPGWTRLNLNLAKGRGLSGGKGSWREIH